MYIFIDKIHNISISIQFLLIFSSAWLRLRELAVQVQLEILLNPFLPIIVKSEIISTTSFANTFVRLPNKLYNLTKFFARGT